MSRSTEVTAELQRLEALEAGGLSWRIRPGVQSPQLLAVLERPDEFLKDPTQLFKNTRLVTIGRISAGEPGRPGLVLRRLNYGRFRHRLRDCFRPSRASRAMRRSLALEEAGIPVPRALAVAVKRSWHWPVVAYFLTEEIAPTTTLKDFLAGHDRVPNRLLKDLAGVFARLHSSGFIRGDTKSTNILLDAGLRPWLIDIDSVRQFGRTPDRDAIRELARFACEFRPYPRVFNWGGLRFIVDYCRRRNLSSAERAWVHRIVIGMQSFPR